jgi:hypothetical protein
MRIGGRQSCRMGSLENRIQKTEFRSSDNSSLGQSQAHELQATDFASSFHSDSCFLFSSPSAWREISLLQLLNSFFQTPASSFFSSSFSISFSGLVTIWVLAS